MSIETTQEFKKFLKNKKVIVDTSTLLLSGVGLINIISDSTLIIPAIVVKELEDKRTHSTVGFLAREWLRFLEDLRKEYGIELATGILLPYSDNVIVQVEPNHKNQKNLPEHLQDGSNDSTILAVAKNLSDEENSISSSLDGNIVILSNDVPMRIHATLDLKIPAIEFNSTFITKNSMFDGTENISLTYEEYLNSNAVNKDEKNDFLDIVKTKCASKNSHCLINVFLDKDNAPVSSILKNNKIFQPLERHLKVGKISSRSIEQDVALTYLNASCEDIPIVSLGGKAGTGKSLLTIASAVDQLDKGIYQHIIVLRSLHEMGEGQDMGFLPGDVDEKMAPWAGAIWDAIDVIALQSGKDSAASATKVKVLRSKVEISPITYLRGRSLSNSFIVLEEAQNFSRKEILNILSRAGENSKIVLTWDDNQVDNRFLQMGKDADIWSIVESFKEKDLFAHITLKNTERSKVAEISAQILSEDFNK